MRCEPGGIKNGQAFDEMAKHAHLTDDKAEKHDRMLWRLLLKSRYSMEVGMQNWYAVQVMTGKEDVTCMACRRVLNPRIFTECFTPKYERMRRYRGQWHWEERPMFPGYLFFVTGQIDQIHHELKKLPQLTKILGNGAEFLPLKDGEVRLLTRLEDEQHLIRMSEGYIVGDQIIITSGPMQEMSGTIRKIDRHKRIATIQMELLGRQMDVVMGLEIIKKI